MPTILTLLPALLPLANLHVQEAATELVQAEVAEEVDLRDAYDVQTYRLDIRVDPKTKTVVGTSMMESLVLADELSTIAIDLWSGNEKQAGLTAARVTLLDEAFDQTSAVEGTELSFTHTEDLVLCELPEALSKGATFRVAITYSGTPGEQGGFTGFHWKETADGSPWIDTSCQGTGAHWWWPCKANFYNADDKHERIFVNATVPSGLYAVSNGKLQSRAVTEEGFETFRWFNPYGCDTYSITLNIAPFVVVESELTVVGLDEKVPFIYYVLPENAEKAAVQFAQVPELVHIFSEAFGPFPFPDAKFGLVETTFWGMEHSTAVAYGSSYPLWCQQNGEKDRYANRNRYFDYILVHEVAHEWWGNAVSAKDWGHFWIHEGFGTYAEGVYVEKTQGREKADEFFQGFTRRPTRAGRIYRGSGKNSGEAYSGVIYGKGAVVLNTLRHYVADDNAWWKSLREFNLAYRYKLAVTEDFQAILERNTGREWGQFFEEWVYGVGLPTLKGRIAAEGSKLVIAVDNPTDNDRSFHIPLKIDFQLGESKTSYRITLKPGMNEHEFEFPGELSGVSIEHLERVAGRHEITVEG